MPYDPDVHHRHTIRLKGFDYSQAASYFVTLVTHERECLFGEIDSGQVKQSLAGQCAESLLKSLPNHFPVSINHWIVMPNHIHMLLSIVKNENSVTMHKSQILDSDPIIKGTKNSSLGAVIQNYKSLTTRRIHAIHRNLQSPIWLRNYYEHIVRDQDDFERIADYIRNNPTNWENDDLK